MRAQGRPRTADRPGALFAQNHHGVYRCDDGGGTWPSIADGLPADFGFAIVAHPRRPGRRTTSRSSATGERMPPEARCRVFRTTDAGETWQALAEGLPQPSRSTAACCATRCAPTTPRSAGVYFGTRSGEVFASRDEGDTWSEVARTCPTCSASARRHLVRCR